MKRKYSVKLSGLAAVTSLVVLAAGCATAPGDIQKWSVTNAEARALTGTVVDVQCELSGNCPDACGAGKRQLAIKTEDQGVVLAAKNLNFYSGAADELSPFCGQVVEVNGLFTENRGIRFFQVQNVRTPGGQWQKGTRYLQAWSERSGKSPSVASKWYNNDDRVKDVLEKDGRLGLGQAADDEYFN